MGGVNQLNDSDSFMQVNGISKYTWFYSYGNAAYFIFKLI